MVMAAEKSIRLRGAGGSLHPTSAGRGTSRTTRPGGWWSPAALAIPHPRRESPMSTLRRMVLVSLLLFLGIADSAASSGRSEEHTSELQSRQYLVCRLLLEKKHRSTSGTSRSHRSGS